MYLLTQTLIYVYLSLNTKLPTFYLNAKFLIVLQVGF